MLDLFQIIDGRLIPILINYENVNYFQTAELDDGTPATRIYFSTSTQHSIHVNAGAHSSDSQLVSSKHLVSKHVNSKIRGSRIRSRSISTSSLDFTEED